MSNNKAFNKRDEMHLSESAVALEDGPETAWDQNSQIVIANEIPKMERIRFFNLLDGAKEVKFFYHSKTHPLRHYTLLHNHEYDLPYEIIDHIEGNNEATPNSCSSPIYENETTPDGKQMKSNIKGYKSKYQCKRVRRLA